MAGTTLYRAGRVLTPADPRADALVVANGVVAWVGAQSAVGTAAVDEVVDLGPVLVTPAFVDAHVHLTQSGLMASGADLHDTRSKDDLLDFLARRAAPGRLVFAGGWDETTFTTPGLPSLDELDRAAGGGLAYLARTDVHSALASPALLARAGASAGPDGLVRAEEHHRVRRVALDSMTPGEIAGYQRLALRLAAARGVGTVHEMSGPEVASVADLESALAIAAGEEPVAGVVAYWGSLGDVETPSRFGLLGAGGDLFCDGSVGSRTAALHEPYADAPGHTGWLYHSPEEIAEHVVLCARAGLQAGFHVIGDRAIDAVLDAFDAAATVVGREVLVAGRHRLEHCELAAPDAIRRIASWGIVVSAQPAFDAAWGGDAAMYAERLGPDRALAMNPFAAFAAAGVPLAFGSDCPVTAIDPWAGVRAAVYHRTAGAGLTARAAFAAHTRGGHRAARDDGAGVLVAGAPATFAAWDTMPAPPSPPDAVIEAWSTDPGWGDAGLPDLSETPTCLRTVVRGRTVFVAEGASP